MAQITNFEKFTEMICETKFWERQVELADINVEKGSHIVAISFDENALLEFNKYQKLGKGNKWFRCDQERTNPPMKRHFHVCGRKDGGFELYAVNIDGTARHRRNKGVQISPQDADALRNLGVNIPKSNIVEWVSYKKKALLLEAIAGDSESCLLLRIKNEE